MVRLKLAISGAVLMFGSGGCAPPIIPSDASWQWELKNGSIWYWEQEAAGGCISWKATERWASIRVSVDSECLEWGADAFRESKGLMYSSTSDESTFYGYWPWPRDTSFDYYEFDEKGNWTGTKPCPHSLSGQQIAEIEKVVRSARQSLETRGERRILHRLSDRLAQLDGSALSISQFGCSDADLKSELGKEDAWTED